MKEAVAKTDLKTFSFFGLAPFVKPFFVENPQFVSYFVE